MRGKNSQRYLEGSILNVVMKEVGKEESKRERKEKRKRGEDKHIKWEGKDQEENQKKREGKKEPREYSQNDWGDIWKRNWGKGRETQLREVLRSQDSVTDTPWEHGFSILIYTSAICPISLGPKSNQTIYMSKQNNGNLSSAPQLVLWPQYLIIYPVLIFMNSFRHCTIKIF